MIPAMIRHGDTGPLHSQLLYLALVLGAPLPPMKHRWPASRASPATTRSWTAVRRAWAAGRTRAGSARLGPSRRARALLRATSAAWARISLALGRARACSATSRRRRPARRPPSWRARITGTSVSLACLVSLTHSTALFLYLMFLSDFVLIGLPYDSVLMEQERKTARGAL